MIHGNSNIKYHSSLRCLRYFTGNIIKLWIGRLSCPELVITVAILMCPSGPGNVSWWLLISKIWEVKGLSKAAHAFRAGSLVACCTIVCIVASCSSSQMSTFIVTADWSVELCCQLDKLFIVVLVNSGSGREVKGASIRKWPRLKQLESLGSWDNAMRVHEFKSASICAINILNT